MIWITFLSFPFLLLVVVFRKIRNDYCSWGVELRDSWWGGPASSSNADFSLHRVVLGSRWPAWPHQGGLCSCGPCVWCCWGCPCILVDIWSSHKKCLGFAYQISISWLPQPFCRCLWAPLPWLWWASPLEQRGLGLRLLGQGYLLTLLISTHEY